MKRSEYYIIAILVFIFTSYNKQEALSSTGYESFDETLEEIESNLHKYVNEIPKYKNKKILYESQETPFYRLSEEYLQTNFGINKSQLIDLAQSLYRIFQEHLLKIHSFNLIPLDDDKEQCMSLDQCSLYPCDSVDSEKCLRIFEKSECSKEHGCHIDIKGCSFYDLSIPINEESNTNFRGYKATLAWQKLKQKISEIDIHDNLMSKFLSGINFNITTHISKNFSYDQELGKYTENIYDFFERFVPKYGSHYKDEYFEDFLTYFFAYHDAFIRYFEYPNMRDFLVKSFLLTDKADLDHLDQAMLLIKKLPKFNVAMNKIDQSILNVNRLDISNIIHDGMTIVQDYVPCKKCRLYGTVQFTGLQSIMEILATSETNTKNNSLQSSSEDLRSLLCPRQIVSMIQSYSRLINSLLYHYDVSQRDCFDLEKHDLIRCPSSFHDLDL